MNPVHYSIDELMKGVDSGFIKIFMSDAGGWFRPFFKAGGLWFGLYQDGQFGQHDAYFKLWQLYVEPKPKKVMYQYALWDESFKIWIAEKFFFESDEHYAKFLSDTSSKSKKFQRLDYTRTELEDE